MWGIIARATQPRDFREISVGKVVYREELKTKGDLMFFPTDKFQWKYGFNFPYKTQKDAKAEFKKAKEIWCNNLLGYETFHPKIIKEQNQ